MYRKELEEEEGWQVYAWVEPITNGRSTISEHETLEIGEFFVAQKRRVTDFVTPNLREGR